MVHLFRKSVTLAAFLSAVARAEPWTNATCTDPETTWTINSLQQSPCLVAAFLGAVCRPDNTWRIPALNGTEYNSYIAGMSNACLCNSVIWSLLSACSLCQQRGSSSWTTYSNGCTTADTSPPGVYPAAIPIGAAVPNWAYYDYVTTGAFNLAIARQQAGPESTAPPRPSSTTASTSTTTSTTSSPTVTSTSAPVNDSSSKSDTGAIVGGVVGGVLGIALFALIAFFIVHKGKQKKREQEPPATTQFDGTHVSNGQYPSGFQTTSFVPTTPSYKPYDPSDPSTFPASHPKGPNVSDSVPNLYYQQNAETGPLRPNVPQL